MSYSTYWNDDDRDTTYIGCTRKTYDDEEEYVPVFKILKEMYDEDKEAMYCHEHSQPKSPLYYYPNNYYGFEDDVQSSESGDDCGSESSDIDEYDDVNSNSDQNDVIDDYVYKRFCYF